jgi:RND superfamily putative drug exporter
MAAWLDRLGRAAAVHKWRTIVIWLLAIVGLAAGASAAGGSTRDGGLALTARVITCAALIMISVFLSFVGNPEPTIKMFGLGLAVAVFIDATVVRLVLVPATMALLGDANWWLPGWLDRILPHIRIEEGPRTAPSPEPVPAHA